MLYSPASTTEKTLWNNIFCWVLPNPPPGKITSAELSHSSHWVSGHDFMAQDALEKEWHSAWHHTSTIKHYCSSVNSGQITQQSSWLVSRTQPSSEKTSISAHQRARYVTVSVTGFFQLSLRVALTGDGHWVKRTHKGHPHVHLSESKGMYWVLNTSENRALSYLKTHACFCYCKQFSRKTRLFSSWGHQHIPSVSFQSTAAILSFSGAVSNSPPAILWSQHHKQPQLLGWLKKRDLWSPEQLHLTYGIKMCKGRWLAKDDSPVVLLPAPIILNDDC